MNASFVLSMVRHISRYIVTVGLSATQWLKSIFRYVTRGRSGALAFDTAMGSIHKFRGEKIVRAEFFRSADEALEAAAAWREAGEDRV